MWDTLEASATDSEKENENIDKLFKPLENPHYTCPIVVIMKMLE